MCSLKHTVLSRCIPTISNIFSIAVKQKMGKKGKSNIYVKISIHALSAYPDNLLTVVVPKAQQWHKGSADNQLSRRCKHKTIHDTSDYRSIWPSIPTIILTDKGRIGRRK